MLSRRVDAIIVAGARFGDRHVLEAATRMALGALSVFRVHGLACPRDISLVGYNNSPTIDQVDPPLTSVAYPGAEVGQAAGSLAFQLIARTDRRIPGAVFQPTILVRESTAPPAATPSRRVPGTTAPPAHPLTEVSDAG